MKTKCINLFNKVLKKESIDVSEIVPLLTEYFEDQNTEDASKAIQIIINNPALISQSISVLQDYFSRKYTICSIMFNNKILMYYDAD